MIETYKNMLVHADTANKQFTKKRDAEFTDALNEAHKICRWALDRRTLHEVERNVLPQACSNFMVIASKHGDLQVMSWDIDPEMPNGPFEHDRVSVFIDGRIEWECDLDY